MEGFGEKCRELATTAAERLRMGSENLRRVEDYFIERCAVMYEEVFERVLKDRQGSRTG